MNIKTMKEPNVNNICAVIITYHPDNDLIMRIERIIKQVNTVVIVDNGSPSDCIEMLKRISLKFKVHLILNKKNLGVATALNKGFDFVINLDHPFEWCLTMDQDTILYPKMIYNLIKAYKDCPFKEEIGILGSNYEEYTTGRILYDKKNSKKSWAEVQHLPTSGCLTSIPVFKSIGRYRDNLFIDYIDTDYCMRLLENGYKVIISPEINMRHPLGYYKSDKIYSFFFGKNMITNYPPIRHYYWTRNGIILVRERFCKNMKWAINELYYLTIRRVAIVLLFEDSKLKKLRNIFLGIFHGCINYYSNFNNKNL